MSTVPATTLYSPSGGSQCKDNELSCISFLSKPAGGTNKVILQNLAVMGNTTIGHTLHGSVSQHTEAAHVSLLLSYTHTQIAVPNTHSPCGTPLLDLVNTLSRLCKTHISVDTS